MLDWLNTYMDIAECARGYDLLPNVNRGDNSLEGVCGTLVQYAFGNEIQGKHILLTDDDSLRLPKEAIAIPEELFEIWPPDVATEVLDERKMPALCHYITKANRKKLVAWDLLEELTDTAVIRLLETKNSPKPSTWLKLLNLWAYISPKVKDHHYPANPEDIRIVPLQGKDVLFVSKETVRLDKKNLPESKTDQEFLDRHLSSILDQDWLAYLESNESAIEKNDESTKKKIKAANGILKALGLERASPVDKVIKFVADKLFSQNEVSLEECVQITHIAAKLKADVTKLSSEFEYVTRDMYCRSSKEDEFILFDKDGTLEDLLPDEWRKIKLLHEDYSKSFESCSQDEWQNWIMSGRAGLLTSIPLVKVEKDIIGKDKIEKEAEKHDIDSQSLHYKYAKGNFKLKSLDFDEACWRYWDKLARDDVKLWIKLTESIFINCKSYLDKDKHRSTHLFQISTHKTEHRMHRHWPSSSGTSSWLVRLRQLPCLPDRKGLPRKPDDLFRLTHETEPLIGVEDFVEASLDNEQTRPLLDLMGVRKTPGGPDRLLDRLRELSQGTELSVSDVGEIEKLYKHLDRMLSQYSTEDLNSNMIKQAFQSERLILTENSVWQMSSDVFLTSGEEDVPGIRLIRRKVNNLTLWKCVGVAEKPTRDHAVVWLKNLPENSVLDENDLRHVRSLLTRHPDHIWRECGKWCNLAGEWTSVDDLSWSLTSSSSVFLKDLHSWVKRKTADLRFLSQETIDDSTFSHLSNLTTIVEDRFDNTNSERGDRADPEEWLIILGRQLRLVKLSNNEDTQRIRTLASRLTSIKCHKMQVLKTIPYINDQPAGPPRQRDVLWLNDDLFYADLSQAKLAKLIPEEIGRRFRLEDIKAALDYSFRRSAQDVQEYVEANFDLCPACTFSEETPKKVEGSPPSEPQEPKPINGGEPPDKPDESSDVPDTPPGGVVTEEPVKKEPPPRRSPTSPPNPKKPPAKPRVLPGGSSDNQAIAWRARQIIKHVERWLGFEQVVDRESERGLGYDIESRVPGTERLRFIEVKGRSAASPTTTITVTRNEIICSLNNPDKFILAIVEFNEDISDNDCKVQVDYLREPFLCRPGCEPDSNVASVSYDLGRLREGAEMEDTERMTFNDERIILKKNLHDELIDRTYYCMLNLSHRDLE
ncbi:MAG: DUF3883 domain-containing protein [Synechococcus sp. SB0677_bin_5]|nr:DUF3883 domain-containing protein [Synechococcus sp. SB0677_bin_5]